MDTSAPCDGGTVDFLLGRWRGSGRGLSAPGFAFEDEMCFVRHPGRALLEYRQMTRLSDGTPSHGEVGFVVVGETGGLEVTIAGLTGLTETLVGEAGGTRVELVSVEVGHVPGADPVTGTRRRLFLEGEVLVAEIDIAVGAGPLSPHTHSELRRCEDGPPAPLR